MPPRDLMPTPANPDRPPPSAFVLSPSRTSPTHQQGRPAGSRQSSTSILPRRRFGPVCGFGRGDFVPRAQKVFLLAEGYHGLRFRLHFESLSTLGLVFRPQHIALLIEDRFEVLRDIVRRFRSNGVRYRQFREPVPSALQKGYQCRVNGMFSGVRHNLDLHFR